MSVAPTQRFRKDRRCPVCGGWESARKGERCWGFESRDGLYVHCMRDEFAGGLEAGPDGAYAHRKDGECRCGQTHGHALPPAPTSKPRLRVVPPPATESIKEIWKESTWPPFPILTYFESRKLPTTQSVFTSTVRFHEGLPYYDDEGRRLGTYPAMVASVQRIDGVMTGLHRTYLSANCDGKAPVAKPKKATGALSGGAVRLAPAGRVLGICEGIETGLAIRVATGLPVWACLGRVGLRGVELPPFVEEVAIFSDNDANGDGQRDATAKAAEETAAGRTVRLLVPPGVGEDWLDVYAREGDPGLRAALAAAEPWKPTEPEAEGPVLAGVAVSAYLDSIARGRPPAVATPWPALNTLTNGGWRPGRFIVAGGVGGVGKSAFALETAYHAATLGVGVLVVSREMGTDELAGRLLAQVGRVPHHRLESGRLDPEDRQRAVQAAIKIDGLPLVFDPKTAGIEGLLGAIDTWPHEPLGLVVVDYLQLLENPKGIKDRTEGLDALSRSFKALTRSRGLALLLLSSLNRGPEAKGGTPGAHRIRGTGEVEFDADLLLFVHTNQPEARVRDVEVIIAKQRNGPRGRAHLRFIGEYLRFEEPSDREAEGLWGR